MTRSGDSPCAVCGQSNPGRMTVLVEAGARPATPSYTDTETGKSTLWDAITVLCGEHRTWRKRRDGSWGPAGGAQEG